jgi:hypothetical protein
MAKSGFFIKSVRLNDKRLRKLEGDQKNIDRSFVTIGVHPNARPYPDGTSVQDVAFYNEFGTDTIPERSFLRSAVRENRRDLEEMLGLSLTAVLEKRSSVGRELGRIGIFVQSLIRRKILSNIPPPNAASTLSRKTGTRTLVDTRHLVSQIAWEVHE